MIAKNLFAPFVGLTVANVVSAAKTRFAPCRVNRSQNPQFREVLMYCIIKKFVASIARLNPAGSLSAVQKLVLAKAGMPPLLLTFTLMVAALWVSPAAVAAEKETVFDPATGQTWTAHEYGGTLTFGTKRYPKSADVWYAGGWAPHFISGVNEKLAFADWGLSRDKTADFYIVVSPEMTTGCLAESWSQPDPTTFIWHIRQGVFWDNKEPVNGRQFDAYDVEWNYHRYLGLGDFSELGISPEVEDITNGLSYESVTATDKWTVVVKLARPDADVLGKMLHTYTFMYAPEVIEKYGDAQDWRNAVGTGPYRLTDHVQDSSATWEKNPDYWKYDEKWPENRLPYIDKLVSLSMPESATRTSAMRTGKIDMLTETGDAYILNPDYIDALQRTNPEIDVFPIYVGVSDIYGFNQSSELMQDVNVRKALQMSVDIETINTSFYKGYGDTAPYGLISQASKGWNWPYEDWPEEVKQEYTYNPERAEELLDAAGYPRGADGYRFKVKLASSERVETTYGEILMSYFDAIGVDSEIEVVTEAEAGAAARGPTMKWDIHNLVGYSMFAPSKDIYCLSNCADGHWPKTQDQRMHDIVAAMKVSATMEEWMSLHREADEKTVREHYAIIKPKSPKFYVSQPWVEGYFGEAGMQRASRNTFMARLWIDSALKKEMGH